MPFICVCVSFLRIIRTVGWGNHFGCLFYIALKVGFWLSDGLSLGAGHLFRILAKRTNSYRLVYTQNNSQGHYTRLLQDFNDSQTGPDYFRRIVLTSVGTHNRHIKIHYSNKVAFCDGLNFVINVGKVECFAHYRRLV